MRKINAKNLVGEKLLARDGHVEITASGDTIFHEDGALVLVSNLEDGEPGHGEPICIEKKEIKKIASLANAGNVSVDVDQNMAIFTQGEDKATTKTVDEVSRIHAAEKLKEEAGMVDGIYFDIEALEKIVTAAKKFSDKNKFGSKLVKMTLQENMLSIMGRNKDQDQEFLGLLMNFRIPKDVELKGEQW